MISLKQTILLAALVGGMAFVWIPELRQTLPGFLSGEDQASISPAPKGVGFRTDALIGNEDLSQSAGTGDGAKNQGKALAGSPDRWASVLRNFQSEKPAVAVMAKPEEKVDGKSTKEGASLAGWQNQLQSLPLTGILLHPAGNRALLGGQSYQVGQELLPGLQVREILAQSVVLSDGVREVTVSLPVMGAKPAKGASPFQIQTNSQLPTENL